MAQRTPVDYERLFKHAPSAFMVLDRELRYVAANDAYLAIVATPLEQLLGRPIFDVFPHDPLDPKNENQRRLRQSFENVFATGKVDTIATIVYRVPVQTAEGPVIQERYWSATHTPIFDEAGRVEAVLQHTEDVTELQRLRSNEPKSAASVLRRAEVVQGRNDALETEREHLLSLFEQAPVFTAFLRGREHVIELANAAYLKLVGDRDVIGRRVDESLPDAAAQGFVKLLNTVYDTRVPFVGRDMKFAVQATPEAVATERYVDFVYQPILEQDGSVSGIFVVGSDTTAQHNAAAARNQLATIVEQSSDFIAAVDAAGKLLFVNEGGRALMGLGDRALSDLAPLDFFFPSDHEFVTGAIHNTLLERGRWHGEFRMRHLVTNEPIPVDYNVFLMKDATGSVTGVASVTRDLRERKKAEQERLFLADAIPEQVWTANPEGALVYVNDRVTSYFGATQDDVLASGWLSYLHPDDVEPCLARWKRSLTTGEPYTTEFRLRATSGEYRWHLARGLALRDGRGNITKWYGTNSDIDDQKRVNEEREHLIAALAASNRELDRFAYVASHDLKTPLRGIGNLAQWIEDDAGGALSAQSKSHLELLRGRVARMDALIDGVLRYSRSLKPDDHVQEVDVRDLVDVVVDLVAPPPEVKVVVDGALPVLRSPYVALQQVFLNLIGNAIKHAGRPDVVIRVSARQDGPFYEFCVSDNGTGISPEHHQRIWDLFQTLEVSHSGTGIGLSVVKRLVELQGGAVSVGKGPQGGAAFRFTWPKDPPQKTPAGGVPVVPTPAA